eukprot:jgi/Ulvmu1/4235/UM191_0008.1
MNSVSSGRGTGRSAKSESVGPFTKRAPGSSSKGLNDRSTFLSLCLVGRSVTVKTTDGHQYKGLFYCMKETEQGEMHLVLSHASHNDDKETIPYATIPYSVFQSLSAEEIDLAGQDISATPFATAAGFEDTANAIENPGNERKLEAFVFDANVAEPGLEDARAANLTGGWSGNDMFAENGRRFGVTATFEESMYTTGLEDANISSEDAERLAQGILAERGGTAHEREERGQIDDSGLTEEDKYGAVLRHPGAARPPAVPPPPDGSDPSPTALPPPGPPPMAVAGSNGTARSERQEINTVRRKLVEGKSVQTAVDPQLRTKYINDAPGVDALNLMPGHGSHKFRKDKVSGVAHRLNDFKSKRQSASSSSLGGGSKPPAAAGATPAAAQADDDAAPAPAAAAAGASPAPAAPPDAPASSAPPEAAADADAGTARPSTSMKMRADATPFSFNPKSAPFMPGKKTQEGSSSSSTDGPGGGWGGRKAGWRERGDGVRGGRGRPGRSHDGFNGPHSMPRQAQGFMYPTHMGMQALPGIMVSQGMAAGPHGTPIAQIPGGGFPVAMPYAMHLPFNHQMAQMSQPMHPMHVPGMGTPGGYPMQPNMQPGYTHATGQSPPNTYAPPPNI